MPWPTAFANSGPAFATLLAMRCVLSDATGNRYPVGYCLQSGNVTELRVADLLRLCPVGDAGDDGRMLARGWRMAGSWRPRPGPHLASAPTLAALRVCALLMARGGTQRQACGVGRAEVLPLDSETVPQPLHSPYTGLPEMTTG